MSIELSDELKALRKIWEDKERKSTNANIAATRAFGNYSRALTAAGIVEEPVPKRGGKRKEAEPDGVPAASAAAPAAAPAASEPPKKKGKAATKKVATKAAAEKK